MRLFTTASLCNGPWRQYKNLLAGRTGFPWKPASTATYRANRQPKRLTPQNPSGYHLVTTYIIHQPGRNASCDFPWQRGPAVVTRTFNIAFRVPRLWR